MHKIFGFWNLTFRRWEHAARRFDRKYFQTLSLSQGRILGRMMTTTTAQRSPETSGCNSPNTATFQTTAHLCEKIKSQINMLLS